MYDAEPCVANVSCSTNCDKNYTNGRGLVISPSYPNQYPPGKDCTYIVTQPNGTYVHFNITNIDVDCQEMFGADVDYLEVRDGNSEESPMMGKWCGNGSDIPATMQTTQNHLRIRFETSSSPFYNSNM